MVQIGFGAKLGWEVGTGWADFFNWDPHIPGGIVMAAGALIGPFFSEMAAREAAEWSAKERRSTVAVRLQELWTQHLAHPVAGILGALIGFVAAILIEVWLSDRWVFPPDWFSRVTSAGLIIASSGLLWLIHRSIGVVAWCLATGLLLWLSAL